MATERGIGLAEAAAPDGMRIYAVGDVHGCYDLLARMHEQIVNEVERDRPDDWRVIYLGDCVDRGPQSRQVLEFLSSAVESDPRVIALAGNHDRGMLSFLRMPRRDSIFAGYGGDATARSYGVELAYESHEAFVASAARLAEAIPEKHRRFLKGLGWSASFGDLFFCHAGIRPGVPLDRQSREDLIWIRDEFLEYPGLHPKLIVHGHTPHSAPQVLTNRVNLDTGAFRTGILSGMKFEGAGKALVQISAPEGF